MIEKINAAIARMEKEEQTETRIKHLQILKEKKKAYEEGKGEIVQVGASLIGGIGVLCAGCGYSHGKEGYMNAIQWNSIIEKNRNKISKIDFEKEHRELLEHMEYVRNTPYAEQVKKLEEDEEIRKIERKKR